MVHFVIEPGGDIDSFTAELLLHMMVLVGVLVNTQVKGELIRNAADPLKQLFKECPALGWIADFHMIEYRSESHTFAFSANALQQVLATRSLQTSA